MVLQPLAFRLSKPDVDSFGLSGVKSVSYKVDGLLHVSDQSLALEWKVRRTVEQFSLEKIGTDVETLPPEWIEIPLEQIASALVIGRWFPKLELRARRLDVFDEVPSSRGATLRLRIHRRDRNLARELADEITALAEDLLLDHEDRPRLDPVDSGW